MGQRHQPIEPSTGSELVRIFCVDPKLVHRIWHLAKPILAPAFDKNSDATIEAVERDALCGLALLWLATDDGKLIAAATTAINQTPRHKICLVTSAGGVHSTLWDQFMPMVESYAKAEGCELVRAAGRAGWARVLTGYRQPWIVLDKRLD
jgi:hypothetical protein